MPRLADNLRRTMRYMMVNAPASFVDLCGTNTDRVGRPHARALVSRVQRFPSRVGVEFGLHRPSPSAGEPLPKRRDTCSSSLSALKPAE